MTIERRNPGDKKISASDWNKLADRYNGGMLGGTGRDSGEPSRSPVVVLVKNNTGTDLGKRAVIGLGDSLISLADNERQWKEEIVLNAELPEAGTHDTKYAILQSSLRDGQIGEAMVIGVTQVLLDVQSESDTHAKIVDGETDYLETGASGTAEIIWKASGTGQKLGIVMLDRSYQEQGIPFRNDSGEEIPPYAVMEIVDGNIGAGELLGVIKPTSKHNTQQWLINGSKPIPIDGTGSGFFSNDTPRPVLYLRTAWTSGGNSFSPVPGYWHIAPDIGQNREAYYMESFGFIHVYDNDSAVTGDSDASYQYDYGGEVGEDNIKYAYFRQYQETPIVDHPYAIENGGPETGITDITTISMTLRNSDHNSDDDNGYRNGSKPIDTSDPYTDGSFEITREGHYEMEAYIKIASLASHPATVQLGARATGTATLNGEFQFWVPEGDTDNNYYAKWWSHYNAGTKYTLQAIVNPIGTVTSITVTGGFKIKRLRARTHID